MSKCRICDWEGETELIQAREMMIGTRQKFDYFVCPICSCLQIDKVPENLGEYYNNSTYYSFGKPDGSKMDIEEKTKNRILDVGCGAGAFLCQLYREGHVNLTGCDPYLEDDIEYENGVKIYAKTIHEMEGEYDVIYMMDSFEHVLDPHEVFESVHRLLAPQGLFFLRLPVFPNIAYDMFGADWYQLDAPRHICLHSTKSLDVLAQKHNFVLAESKWTSGGWMIERSYMYKKDIPFWEQTEEMFDNFFPPEVHKEIIKNAAVANENKYGDHADFIYYKKR